jgi:GT2 family glycosyltransferase
MENISFVINTCVNELYHLKLLLNSLKKNLDNKKHEIIIFIDSDNQDTYGYLKSIKKDFYDLKIITHKLPHRVAYQRNKNLLVKIAKYDIISYLQSDMVISPHYDTDVLSNLEPNCILSAARVEPPLHGESDKTITKDFGVYPEKFDLDKWNSYSVSVKEDKTFNYFFAPLTFYKNIWLDIGGYDTLFRRSREDSDFVQRCLHKNIKLKYTFNAIVYHFTCVSSRGKDWFNSQNTEAQNKLKLQQQADSIEVRKFLRKWGSFSHENKVIKYDIDLNVNNCDKIPINLILNIEPLFSRVWLDNNDIKNQLILEGSKENQLANYLQNITEEQWEKSKHLFNTTKHDDIFLSKKDLNQYNILLTIDGSSLDLSTDLELFKHLHLVLKENPIGNYEFGNIQIDIKHKKPTTNIIVDNPPFDMNLLKIE